MKAQKVTVTIVVEVLSIDVVSGLVPEALLHIDREHENGFLSSSDGDSVKWTTVREDVEF